MILCDTNVIIETLKGDEKTIKIMESIGLENIAISSVTVMELYFGAFNKRELNKIKKHLKALNIVHFDNEVSELAVSMIEIYGGKHPEIDTKKESGQLREDWCCISWCVFCAFGGFFWEPQINADERRYLSTKDTKGH